MASYICSPVEIAHGLLRTSSQREPSTSAAVFRPPDTTEILLWPDNTDTSSTTRIRQPLRIQRLALRTTSNNDRYFLQCITFDRNIPFVNIIDSVQSSWYFEIRSRSPSPTDTSSNETSSNETSSNETSSNDTSSIDSPTPDLPWCPFVVDLETSQLHPAQPSEKPRFPLVPYSRAQTELTLEQTHTLLQQHIPDLPSNIIQSWPFPLHVSSELQWPTPSSPHGCHLCYLFADSDSPQKNQTSTTFLNSKTIRAHAVLMSDYSRPSSRGLYHFRNHLLLCALLPLLRPETTLYLRKHGNPSAFNPLELQPAVYLQRPHNLLLRLQSAIPAPAAIPDSRDPPEGLLSLLMPPTLPQPPADPNPEHSPSAVFEKIHQHLALQHLRQLQC